MSVILLNQIHYTKDRHTFKGSQRVSKSENGVYIAFTYVQCRCVPTDRVHSLSVLITPAMVDALVWRCLISSAFRFCRRMLLTPFSLTTHGRLRKTSWSIPCRP